MASRPGEQHPSPFKREVYSVSALNEAARDILESGFPPVWVHGEISNLAQPSSGHLYFSLKDEGAQVRCAMFRGRNRYLRFPPEDGLQVLAHARVSLYPERGEYQLIVEHMEEYGAGALRRAFEALKQRLAAEGLFDERHKQPLPEVPRRVGVITSPTGAALRDILSVLERRFPSIPILLYPVAVQGTGAAGQIAEAIALASTRADCDVLILARGGGSLEDLWAFNEERVARAIFACSIPLVSGIGHEIDFTIADFVADRRAATPSAAAELVSPDAIEVRRRCVRLTSRLDSSFRARLTRASERWSAIKKRLVHPKRRLRDTAQRLDASELRLRREMRAIIERVRARMAVSLSRFERLDPRRALPVQRTDVHRLGARLERSSAQQLATHRAQLLGLNRALATVSPSHTLARGYAIVSVGDAIVRSSDEVSPGTRITARLARGSIVGTVDEILD